MVLGAFGIASLFGRPVAGALNDSLGSRPVVLFGTVALAAGASLMSLTTHPALLFGLRVLQAAGYVTFTTAATALVADLAPQARRGATLALFGVAANVAITLTPATVSAGLDLLTPQFSCPSAPCPLWCTEATFGSDSGLTDKLCPLWGRGIGHSAFWLSAWLSLLAGAVVWRVIPRGMRRELKIGQLVARPSPLRGPMLTTWLFGVSFGALFAFLPLLAERRGFAPVGAAYAVYGVSIIATCILTGRLVDRPERGQVLRPALLVKAVGLAGFAFAGTMPPVLASAALMGVGSGIAHPALIAICVDRMEGTRRGRATASFYLAFDLGIGLGSWLLGVVLNGLGLTGLYVTASLLSVAGALSAPLLSGRRTLPEEARA